MPHKEKRPAAATAEALNTDRSQNPYGAYHHKNQAIPSRAVLARRWPGLRVNRLSGRWIDDATGAKGDSMESLLVFLRGGAPMTAYDRFLDDCDALCDGSAASLVAVLRADIDWLRERGVHGCYRWFADPADPDAEFAFVAPVGSVGSVGPDVWRVVARLENARLVDPLVREAIFGILEGGR